MPRPELGAQGSLWPSLTAVCVPELDMVNRIVYSFSGYYYVFTMFQVLGRGRVFLRWIHAFHRQLLFSTY